MNSNVISIKDIVVMGGFACTVIAGGVAYGVNTQSLKDAIIKVDKVESVNAVQWNEISEVKITNREQTIILQQVSENQKVLSETLKQMEQRLNKR